MYVDETNLRPSAIVDTVVNAVRLIKNFVNFDDLDFDDFEDFDDFAVAANEMWRMRGLGKQTILEEQSLLSPAKRASSVAARTELPERKFERGTRTRTIGEPMQGVHTLRTLDDAIAIRSAFEAKPSRVVVIGAGFIGAEVAATARELGLEVTMIEMAEAPFERSLGAEMGQVLADVHRDHGVDLRLGVGCQEIVGGDKVESVTLTDGTSLDADVVVVGIGVIPNIEWLEGSGLSLGNGVVCDETSLAAPGIVAAGDVAEWPNGHFGDVMRVEHWDNAITQGVHAAKRLLHGESVGPYEPVPWFWSDQYDRKIQLAGRTTGFDEFAIVDGDIESRRFAAIYGRAGTLVAVLGFNRPRHVMRYRQLIDTKTSWADALAAEF